jgi:hypothetical protein
VKDRIIATFERHQGQSQRVPRAVPRRLVSADSRRAGDWH